MDKLFRGCLSVRKEDGWYRPVRFTDRQIESYAIEPGLEIRCLSPAGCKLSFYSSATQLEFDYRIESRARDWAVFDVWKDNVLCDSISVSEDTGHVVIKLDGNPERHIEVYLPHLVRLLISNIVADAELIPADDKNKLWLCLGDSITQGMDSHYPSCSYPTLVGMQLDYDVLNMGVGGGMFDESNLDYIGREPEMITVALGCNDWGKVADADALRKNVAAYLKRLTTLYACRNVYGILPIWRSDEAMLRSGLTFAQARAIIQEEYEKYSFIKIIDGMKLVPKLTRYFADPGDIKVHPNEEGFLFYSINLARALNR